MDKKNKESGAVLIVVALFFAVVGILFGLGRLKVYEYQVERRLDRQYQVDKMLATRSSINFLKYASEYDYTESFVEFHAYTNLKYQIKDSNQTLVCDLVPTPTKECQEMSDLSAARFNDVWRKYLSHSNSGMYVVPITELGREGGAVRSAKFGVSQPTSNEVYRAAIFREADYTWLDNQFGYLYRLEPKSGHLNSGYGFLRLYIVGAGKNGEYLGISQANYLSRLDQAPHIMMEVSLVGADEDLAQRKIEIVNSPGKRDLNYSWVTRVDESDSQNTDPEYMQASGLLLSASSMVGFKENSMGDITFTDCKFDLTEYIHTNDYSRVTVVLEHVFQTNMVKKMDITLNSFIVKEPSTYRVSVYNSNLGYDTERSEKGLMTWVFQTYFPRLYNVVPEPGKQCQLDTFGCEATSLRRERQGEWATPGIQ